MQVTRSLDTFAFLFSALPTRPPPPVVGKVTHHTVELYWEDAMEKVSDDMIEGDQRIRVAVQEEDRQGQWGNVYM